MELDSFCSAKVLVLGDLILDRYVFGSVERISPEAPVPILEQKEESYSLGGAGNLAKNICSLGAKVHLITDVCPDFFESRLVSLLEEASLTGWVRGTRKSNSVKSRFIANGQQLLRLDQERVEWIDPLVEERIFKKVEELIKDSQVLLISDYGKGVCTPTLLSRVISLSKSLGCPVLVDPKGVNFQKYRGAELVKPNRKEAIKACGLEATASLEELGAKLLSMEIADRFLITSAEEGMFLFTRGESSLHIASQKIEVVDVTGAGDTVMALLGICRASALDWPIAMQVATTAASLVVQRMGCSQVTLSELQRSLANHGFSRPIVF